jgi:hypothetical protein
MGPKFASLLGVGGDGLVGFEVQIALDERPCVSDYFAVDGA